MVGSDRSYAAKEDQRSVDGEAPTCDEEAGLGRRLGAENIVRHCARSYEKRCRGYVIKMQARTSTDCTIGPCWKEVRNQIPEGLWKWEQRAKTSKEDWKGQRGITSQPLSDRQLEEKS